MDHIGGLRIFDSRWDNNRASGKDTVCRRARVQPRTSRGLRWKSVRRLHCRGIRLLPHALPRRGGDGGRGHLGDHSPVVLHGLEPALEARSLRGALGDICRSGDSPFRSFHDSGPLACALGLWAAHGRQHGQAYTCGLGLPAQLWVLVGALDEARLASAEGGC